MEKKKNLDSLTKEAVMHRPLPTTWTAAASIFWKRYMIYLSKTAHHLLDQGPHRSYVDDLEVIHIDSAIHVDVLPYLSEHTHQSHIGLPSTLEGSETKPVMFICYGLSPKQN